MKGLTLLEKVGSRSWNICSFHSPHSLTWSWLLCFCTFPAGAKKTKFLFGKTISNQGVLQWRMIIPFIGVLSWQAQRPMWYRDLYRKQKDEYRQELIKFTKEIEKNRELVFNVVKQYTPIAEARIH